LTLRVWLGGYGFGVGGGVVGSLVLLILVLFVCFVGVVVVRCVFSFVGFGIWFLLL